MTEPWVFPVGHYLGPFYPGRDADPGGHRVRVGHEVVTLFTETEFAVWTLAHGLPEAAGAAGSVRWTRRSIETAVRQQNGAEAGGVVGDLLRDGVLVEVGPGATEPAAFARRYRFRGLLFGLGASRERPGTFHIGLVGRPLATVDGPAFEFWEWAPLHATIWDAWQAAAAVETALGGAEPVADEALDRLQTLLTAGCGYLDLAADEREHVP
jgi:hypothetical protein